MLAMLLFLAGTQVQLLESVGAPASLGSAQFGRDRNSTTAVSFTVTNHGAAPIAAYTIRVFRATAAGRPLGFRTFVRSQAVEPGASVQDRVALGWNVSKQEQVSLAIVSVTSSAASWKGQAIGGAGSIPERFEAVEEVFITPAELFAELAEEPPCTPPCEANFCPNERNDCAWQCRPPFGAGPCIYSFRCVRKCTSCESDCVCKTTWNC